MKCGTPSSASAPPPSPRTAGSASQDLSDAVAGLVRSVQSSIQPPHGVPVAPAVQLPAKSKILAGLLGLLLGVLGIHNFYLGYSGRGAIQLILTLFTCGWGSIITFPWSVIEAILILTGGMHDSDGRPLA